MSISIRDGKFDVVIVAGPHVEIWPSAGVRALSLLCAEMGLTIGMFGGEDVRVRGVIPNPGTGGTVLIEDVQRRMHRIQARAIVKVSSEAPFPDPFPGWRTQGLIPLSTALKLWDESQLQWSPSTVILGTGNRALKFGSTLLQAGVPEVYCVESYAQWSAKRFAGWEVEKRRFEMYGGRLIEARPIQLTEKAPLLWELKLQDDFGVRVHEVGRVVAAGPFRDLPGVREYPQGSFLFEITQTAGKTKAEDAEGWVYEEERGRYLAGRIVKFLVHDLGPQRETLDRVFQRARGRLKRYGLHREFPFTPAYQGKWVGGADAKRIREFSGTPKVEMKRRPVASVECFEEIPCNICHTVCPVSAIETGRVPRIKPVLDENKCTGCTLCLNACPSASISMFQERDEHPLSSLTLSWRGARAWKLGELATLLNRKGETLGSARIVALPEVLSGEPQLVQLEVPTHLVWEARSLRHPKPEAVRDDQIFEALERSASAEHKVAVTLNGEKRLVRSGISTAVALFEMGQGRPEDTLLCDDGSCGLCTVTIDGVKKLACQTEIHRGMAVKLPESPESMELKNLSSLAGSETAQNMLCPCMDITREKILERLHQGQLKSPEALLSILKVGEGKCHGQLCMASLRRVLLEQGLDVSQWIDWRFPWSEWVLTHS